MAKSKYIKQFIPRIKKLLEDKPYLREDKHLVVHQIIWEQFRKYREAYPDQVTGKGTAQDLIMFMAKKLYKSRAYAPNIEGLYRAQRKVKEMHPELYGKADQQRARREAEVRKESNEIKKNPNLEQAPKQGELF